MVGRIVGERHIFHTQKKELGSDVVNRIYKLKGRSPNVLLSSKYILYMHEVVCVVEITLNPLFC